MSDPRVPDPVDDAFDRLVELALPSDEIDAGFASELKHRVVRALRTTTAAAATTTAATTTATPDTPARADRSTAMPQVTPQVITPYLCVHDARAAIDWYREYFGAIVDNVIEWEGKVGHAELDITGAIVYLSDEAPSLGVLSPTTLGPGASVSLVLHVAVVEEFVARALRGGAVLQREIEESHGTRHAWLLDPYGHRWNVGTPVHSPDEVAARRAPSEPYYMTLTTPDVERGAAFYGAVLGWEFAPLHNGGRHVVNTEMPIGLRPPENPFGRTEPGEIDMWFTVRDFDDAVERVRVAGGTIVSITGYDSGREAICEDDQGVGFKLSEPAPGYDR